MVSLAVKPSCCPVWVLGPGRCGSSTVARLLHERLGVNMGTWLTGPDRENPGGYYEDMAFKTFNQNVLSKLISTESWLSTIRQLVASRNASRLAWGLKDPRMCYLLGHYLNLCPNAILIRCIRPMELVAASMTRCYGWDNAMAIATEREKLLDIVEQTIPMNRIEIQEYRSDEGLVAELKNIIHQKELTHG